MIDFLLFILYIIMKLPKQNEMYFGFPIKVTPDETHIWEWDYYTVDLLFQRLMSRISS